MLTKIHIPLPADKVAKARDFINERFRPMPGQTLNVAKSVAHCVLDQILVGNYVGANVGIAKLQQNAARDFRINMKRNGIELPAA